MLPPVEPAILAQNPQFENLYKILTTSKLNVDGSTKVKAVQDAVQELQQLREEAAQRQTIRLALKQIPLRAKQLPEELREVIETIALQLNNELPVEDRESLEDDLDYFWDHIDLIGKTSSDILEEWARQLVQISHVKPAVPSPQVIAKLPQVITGRQRAISEKRQQIHEAYSTLAVTAAKLVAIHRILLEAMIRTLEQTKYGSVARGLKAQSEYLAVVAETMDSKLRVMKYDIASEIYTFEATTALSNYQRHLLSAQIRLQEREKVANEELRKYQSLGQGMKDISGRYATITQNIDAIRTDIKRLGGEV